MNHQSNSTGDILALPQGGGALTGIGEKFSPDLHTGTGNFTVPIALPPGRNGFQPALNLVYSTGNGNGPFGLGWSLSIPGVSRKTSEGVPRYNEDAGRLEPGERRDVFILSGAEDLVPVEGSYPGKVGYRPRTEGLFARITHYHTPEPGSTDHWWVESKDGLTSFYGARDAAGSTPAVLTKPGDARRIFAWKLTETRDPFGNRICYEYEADSGERGNQLQLKLIRYVDYGDPAAGAFLVHVELVYEDRPDPFSDYRAGFEIRTTRRCTAIKVSTHTEDGQSHSVREYRFTYAAAPYNGVSLLQQLDIIGFDDAGNPYQDDDPKGTYPKQLPPLTFGYTRFAPETRRFQAVEGDDLPARALSAPDMELVDLHGSGLPDILEMNGAVRYWRNLGGGRFDIPRPMQDAPPHSLSDPGVQMLDANGDGRMDLLVTSGPLAGYYPLEHGARWARSSFRPYRAPPSFSLDDPEVKLVDLDGDGYTDILRSGSRLECFFNDRDPALAWTRTVFASRQTLDAFPNVSFSDPRVRLADMNGDGLQDIVLVHDGNVEYWPSLGRNRWGRRLSMRHGPRFPYGYDPQRILLGDVDGDGLADIVYVHGDKVLLWLNQGGNGWSQEPIVIQGTPPSASSDHVRLVDLHGTGVSGVLWSSDATSLSRHRLMFLDFTGGVKPYVLNEMDNHMGAVTRVAYRPSTYYFLEDQRKPATRWRTPLPFPVQVVARVEVIDQVSRGKLTTEYRYHHGYWDGAEREFRGFGMVEQTDTETFADYHAPGLHGDPQKFAAVAGKQFAPPILTKTWFHQGPVGEEFGDWAEIDYADEYWQGDPQLLGHTEQVNAFLGRGDRAKPSPRNRRIKRDALRTLRGSILRSELYALDGSGRQERPYTVTEQSYDLDEIDKPADDSDRTRIFFPHTVAQRTTQWERGDDPMTQFAFTDYSDENSRFDEFGRPHRQTAVAMPRRSAKRCHVPCAVVGTIAPDETHVLASHVWTTYAAPQAGVYIHDRVAQVRSYELANPPDLTETNPNDVQAVLKDQSEQAQAIRRQFIQGTNVQLFGHVLNHYDGSAFKGEDVPSSAGLYGALTRSEALVLTGPLLDAAYAGEPGKPSRRPGYLGGAQALPNGAPAGFGGSTGYHPQTADGTHEAGYYVDVKRVKLDFQDTASGHKRGVSLAVQDALGHETQITPDKYWFLPVGVKDAAGLETKADYDYRTLQPSVVTDPNENQTHFRYNPIGLVQKSWLVANDGQGGSEAEPKPELQYRYDLLNYEFTRAPDPSKAQPICVHTTARQYHAHVSDPTIQHSDEVIESREYSDGFGRLVQKRAQAADLVFGGTGDDVGLLIKGKPEPGKVDSSQAKAKKVQDSVVVSGWQTYDNKGRVVEKYEPFFDQGWAFQPEEDAKYGQHATLFYDPRGQVIRTLNPDGSEQRVILGVPGKIGAPDVRKLDGYEPTPWEGYTYDPNDLAEVTFHPDDGSPGSSPRPLTDVAQDATHYCTPTSTVLDGLGRVVCQVQRSGADPTKEWFVTRSTYDVRGNLLKVNDALGRDAFSHVYDLLNRPLRVDSIDAGLRTSVLDAQGNLIEYRDSKGSVVLHQYDELNRPVGMWAIDDATATQTCTQRERIIYGDKAGLPAAKARNLLGKPYLHYDEAGKLTFERYDFKGCLVEKNRRVVSDTAIAGGWTADWGGSTVDESALEPQGYQTSTTFDALNRPIKITYPAEAKLRSGETILHRAELTPTYNRAGALQSVKLDNEAYVDFIAYNAKGQRVLVAYGNDVMTRYAYDPHTFRLVRMRTQKYKPRLPNSLIWEADELGNRRDWLFQDITYQYDLAGNITAIQDRTPGSGIRNTALGTDALDRALTYDPIYRLLSATGREYATAPVHTWDDPFLSPAPHQQDPTQTSAYIQSFQYDPAGNMSRWRNGATKTFALANNQNGLGSNRLDTVTARQNTASPDVYHYTYDASGNLIQENTERLFTWDHANRMTGFRVQPAGARAASVQARYLYGADGMRVKKWVRKNGTASLDESTVYVDGLFEHHRWRKTGQPGVTNHLHVMDNQSRVALKRVGQLHPDDKGPDVQYHLGEHLGSSHVVVGGAKAQANDFINREEFYPYGATSFGSFGKKRYRHSGKERDEETGLCYYGARYYAPWVARWMSCDPIGRLDGLNLSQFARGSPVRFSDPRGTANRDASTAPRGDRDPSGAEGSTRVSETEFRADFDESVRKLLGDSSKANPEKWEDPNHWQEVVFERSKGRVDTSKFRGARMLIIENGWQPFIQKKYQAAGTDPNNVDFEWVDWNGETQKRPDSDINDALILYGENGEFLGAFQLIIPNLKSEPSTKTVISSWNNRRFGVTWNDNFEESEYRGLKVWDPFRYPSGEKKRVVVDIHKAFLTEGCIEISPLLPSSELAPILPKGERPDFAKALTKLYTLGGGFDKPIGKVVLLGYGAE